MDLLLPTQVMDVEIRGEDLLSTGVGPRDNSGRTVKLHWKTRDVLDRTVEISYAMPQPLLSTNWVLHAPRRADAAAVRSFFVVLPVEGLELEGSDLKSSQESCRLPEWVRERVGARGFQTAESGATCELQVTTLPRVQTALATISRAEYQTRLVADGRLLVSAVFRQQHQAPLGSYADPPVDSQCLPSDIWSTMKALLKIFVLCIFTSRCLVAAEWVPPVEPSVAVGLEVSSTFGLVYQMESCSSLGPEEWHATGEPFSGDGSRIRLFVPAGDRTPRFFRLSMQRAPNDAPPERFVRVPAGSFLMGSPEDEPGRGGDETQHGVTIGQDFDMQATEVTWDQWKGVREWADRNGYSDLAIGQTGSKGGGTGSQPAMALTWHDSVKWLNAWSEKEGRTPCYTVNGTVYRTGEESAVVCDWGASGYRLPTEAEWEYACRAGTTTAFYTGENTVPLGSCDFMPDVELPGWYCGNTESDTEPAGLKQPNLFGLYDMHGNVLEFCWDWYGTYDASVDRDPTGPDSGTNRVVRGGNYYRTWEESRSARRTPDSPRMRDRVVIGFRPALNSIPDAPDPQEPVPLELIPALVIFPAVELRFFSLLGWTYEAQALSSLDSGSWHGAGAPVTGTGAMLSAFVAERERAQSSMRLAMSPPGMVQIGAGTFTMGSSPELSGTSAEMPHEVAITRDFCLQTTEVTWSQWNDVREWAVQNGYGDLAEGRDGYDGDGSGRHPVTGVSWYDAVKWLNAWSERDGRSACYTVNGTVYRSGEADNVVCDWSASGYRLATEAEWEYACRAGTTTVFYTGGTQRIVNAHSDPNLDRAGWYVANAENATRPGGHKQANAWGLYDMHGNAWEWCWDVYETYKPGLAIDPTGPDSGLRRVTRGGASVCRPQECRSAARGNFGPAQRDGIGFRAAMTALSAPVPGSWPDAMVQSK